MYCVVGGGKRQLASLSPPQGHQPIKAESILRTFECDMTVLACFSVLFLELWVSSALRREHMTEWEYMLWCVSFLLQHHEIFSPNG